MPDVSDQPAGRPPVPEPARSSGPWADSQGRESALVVRDGVRIVPLGTAADASAVRALLADARGPQGAPLVDEAEDARLAALAAGAQAPGSWDGLVAWRGGRVVGYAGVSVPPHSGGWAVADLAADRRDDADELVRGALLAAGERRAWQAEAGGLEIWIRDAVPDDQDFARSHGYVIERRLGVLGRAIDGDVPAPAATPDQVVIRALRPGDEDGVVAVLAAAYRDTAEAGWDRDRFEARRAYSWFDPADLLVAVAPGGLIRGLHWLKRRSEDVGEVYNLAVHPDAQGTGLGGALLAAGLVHLRNRGMTSVLLWVDLANERAVRLYRSQGFSIRWEDLAARRELCGPPESATRALPRSRDDTPPEAAAGVSVRTAEAGGPTPGPPAVLARVFHGPGGPGNLTALLQVAERPDPVVAQAAARRLGVPDTGVLWRTPGAGARHLVTYSPHEELAFCTQTLLLAGAVVDQDRVTLQTASGPAEVSRDPTDDGRWWVEAAAPAAELVEPPDLAPLGLVTSVLAGPPGVVGLGRRRLVLALRDRAMFAAAAPPPAAVLALCSAHGWTAVCLVHEVDREAVGLRVFTTSLGGAEDDATGGAALGLLAYRRAVTGVGEVAFRVDQGDPGGPGGASMFVAPTGSPDRGRIGARVDLLLRGTFATGG